MKVQQFVFKLRTLCIGMEWDIAIDKVITMWPRSFDRKWVESRVHCRPAAVWVFNSLVVFCSWFVPPCPFSDVLGISHTTTLLSLARCRLMENWSRFGWACLNFTSPWQLWWDIRRCLMNTGWLMEDLCVQTPDLSSSRRRVERILESTLKW